MRKYAEGMLIGGDVYADIKDVSQNVIYVRFFTNIEMVAALCLNIINRNIKRSSFFLKCS